MDTQALNTAFGDAEKAMDGADALAERAVRYAAGRLRRLGLPPWTLKDLKRELDGFNAKRGKWKTQ